MSAAEQKINSLVTKCDQLKVELQKAIIGQDEILNQLIVSLLAGGHSMLEGVPGLAKTLMIRTLANAINLSFKRIQFTPDLMPSDIIGTEILEEDHSSGKRFFKFNKGPIFAQILLADEINRTPPKTQSALLEAMQEFEVTYGGQTYPLDRPFFILATQNPIEQAGTFPLPEAQLDRFLLYINIDYPDENAERDILMGTTGSRTTDIRPVLEAEEIIEMQKLVRDVTIADELVDYVNHIVRSTRPGKKSDNYINEWVRWGAGLRAGQAMILTSKAYAFLNGRFSVTPNDIKHMAKPVLRHRILMNYKAEAEQIKADSVTDHLLSTISLQNKSLI